MTIANSCQQSVSIATLLELSRNEDHLDQNMIMPTSIICTYPENVAKIGPVHSETIGLILIQKS